MLVRFVCTKGDDDADEDDDDDGDDADDGDGDDGDDEGDECRWGEYTGKEKEKNKENKVMKQSAPQKSKTHHEKRQIKKQQHTLIASHPKTIPNPNSPSSMHDS